MLKKLYKTFLISILCGSILMLDMSVKSGTLYISLNQAKAETLQTGAEGVDKASLMTSLEMLAIGLVSSRLMLYGKITVDIGLAAAGGLAFIAGEVIAQQKLKESAKKIESKINRSKDGKIEDNQLDALINLRQSYNDARDTAETKKTLQTAAAAAFLAAAAIAYFDMGVNATIYSTCMGNTTTVATEITTITTGCSSGTLGFGAAYCGPIAATCSTSSSTYFGMCTKEYQDWVTPGSSSVFKLGLLETEWTTNKSFLTTETSSTCLVPYTPIPALKTAACEIPTMSSRMKDSSGALPGGLMTQVATFVPVLTTMGITNGFGGMVAGGLVAAVLAFSTTLSAKIDSFIISPENRAIVWALMGVGAFLAVSSTDEQIKKLEGEIDKIDNLVNSVQKQSNGVSLANSMHARSTKNLDNTGLTVSANNSNETKLESGSLPCLTKPSSTGKDCPSFSQTLLGLPGINNLPTGLQADVKSISSMTDGLNGSSSISGSTLSSASNVASNAIALKKKVADLKKDAQSKLDKTNIGYNLEKEEKNLREALNKGYIDELKKKNISTGSLLASIGNTGLNAVLSKEVSKDGKVTTKPFKMPEIAMPVIPTMNVPKMTDIKEEKKEEPKVEQAAAATATSIDDYEMTNDINTDKNTSIFDVISRRYEKSGYPRLFKRLNE